MYNLQVFQVKVAVGDSGLCCLCLCEIFRALINYLVCWLILLNQKLGWTKDFFFYKASANSIAIFCLLLLLYSGHER